MTFQTVVKTIARRNGLFADFTPKPLKDHPGNGFHINVSVNASDKEDHMDQIIAGILEKVSDMTVFFNPTENSYQRFGTNKAPLYISWSDENRSQLVRIPAAVEKYRRMELRSPDPVSYTHLDVYKRQHFLCNKKVLLLRTNRCADTFCILISEKAKNTKRLFIQCFH